MLNVINPLAGTNTFVSFGDCSLGKPALLGLHVLSNALIALAYYSIPITLFYIVRKRRDLPFSWLFLLCSAFTVACGTTYLLEIWPLRQFGDWLSGIAKLLTACISITTAILLVLIVPKALAFPNPKELELANGALQQEVAEHKRIQRELTRSRDLREAIFNESADALFLVDPQTLLTLDYNRRAVELFQAVDPAQLVGIEGHTLQRNQFSQKELSNIAAEIQSSGLWSREIEFVTCQGNGFWGNIAVKPIVVAERAMNLVRVTDMSDRNNAERKPAEETLRRYERIVSATTDAILLLDRDYRHQVVNQAYLNRYHKQEDEVIGSSAANLLPPDVFEQIVKPRLDQCLAGQVIQYEMWSDCPTLGRQFLSVTYAPYYTANHLIVGVVASLRNITRLKQAEVELELQSLIARNMAEGICMVKVSDGLFVYANPKFEQMFGYDGDELIGQHVAIVNYEDRNTDTTETYELLVHTILKQGGATYEVQNVKKNGTPFWCQATTSVFEHPNYGAVFVVVQQDITERKRAETVIQASLAEKEVLLKEIHHRVKNNLSIVDSLLHMQLRRSSDPDVVVALKESRNRIASIALVHEKLYGSKDLANIDFVQYIADLTAHLFNSYNTYANQIKLTMQIEPIALDIDTAVSCGLIVNELVTNALKYAFPKGQPGEIQVMFRQHSNHTVTFSVGDNGVGLPLDFNPKQTKTLGITLVQGLVKQLQGTLNINAQPGSTFIISFSRP
ncbi:MAG: PAS domain S-box protein [Stenomitos rutilans HA7619-LM2]|jgi:hypothetical protein|nr:PAS domain S-box protein [Stenomitos rutilans HA7619-LM2]